MGKALIGGYGLGSTYVTGQHVASKPLPRVTPRPSAYTPPPVDPAHVCGPWECYAGSGLSCTVCHRPHPDSWAARCRGGHK